MTNLGWDGIFNTAQLLDGTVEIISVAKNDANYKLQIGLHTGVKSLSIVILNNIHQTSEHSLVMTKR